MLVHLKEILEEKIKGQGALAAFNTFNLEMTQGIVRGIKEALAPAIIQTTEKAVLYAGLPALFNLIKETIKAESGNVPVAIHLDHGKNLEIIREAIDLGYSSVHIDASAYPFEENIKITKLISKLGHAKGVLVQGELGNIYGKEGLIKMQQGESFKNLLTKPEQVKEYVERTGVDTVAVSIGSLHGQFIGQEKLDLARLEKIHEEIGIPIVLHGGSGVSDAEIQQAIKLGVKIINVDTDLRIAFSGALRETLKLETAEIDPRQLLAKSIKAVARAVTEKIKLFNLS